MSARRAERLVNLVICLLSTRQFLSAERIRVAVPGYAAEDGTAAADEAFKRTFERDKAELRELGVPLETGRNGWGDTEEGYRIARRDYELPEIDLTADEAAAVGLAARLWQSAGLSAAAAGALQKLRAAGIDVDSHAAAGIQPQVRANDPAFEACLGAVRDRQPIRFDYRRPRAADAETREVQPWGVVSWHGRWYLAAYDVRRDAPRCFRLSRITGPVRRTGRPGTVTVPPGADLMGLVADSTPAAPRRTATVRLAPGRGAGLRRTAESVRPDPAGDLATVRYADPESLAAYLVGLGAGVEAIEPPEVRAAVVRQLRRIAEGASNPAAVTP